ncbi:response regulator transcription factor [Paenibacillus sp. M.A.Huq-84]
MKNGDSHDIFGSDFKSLNELPIQKIGATMQDFSDYYQLTQRESEILMLIVVYGFANREIAERCVISEKTVKNHLANIMNKIGIKSMRKLIPLLFSHVLYSHEKTKS